LVSTASKILVTVNGGSQDGELVDFACYQAKRARGKLYAVYVIEVKRELPLEVDLPAEVEKGEEILQKAEEVARHWKQEMETEVLQARDAGTAIVEEAERRDVDLVIVGLRYRKKFDQFYVGSTVSHVLKNAPCRVDVCREPIP
jgi:nucleotide-binding universal stress UspA family protein